MDIVSTRCEVKITTPEGYKITFTSMQPQGDLISVETNKDLGDACGSFMLEFAPSVEGGKTWDERIPMRSLVEIRMERPGDAAKLPQGNATVMIGLTDDHARSEQYQQVNPTRTVTISGREISGVLLDAALFFHPMLIKSSGEGTGGGIQSVRANLFGLGALGAALAWQPDLLKNGISPIENLSVILKHFLLGGGTTPSSSAPAAEPAKPEEGEVSASIIDPETGKPMFEPSVGTTKAATNGTAARPATAGAQPEGAPVINLYLPDRPLNKILVLNEEAWTTFQPCEVSIGQNSAFMNSVYNYCQICIDPAFQEFFTRVEDGVSKIHFRGKPFKQEKVTTGTRFDEGAKTCRTLTLPPSWILSANLRRNSQAIYNIFWVVPMGTMNLLDATSMGYLARPATIVDPKHPSSLVRYGIRLMKVMSPYLPAYGPGTPGGSMGGKDIPYQAPIADAPQGPLPVNARIPTEHLKKNQVVVAEMAAKVAEKEGVPAPMIPSFLANMQVESNFDPRAEGPDTGKGRGTAKGLGQLLDSTAQHYGVTNSFDPLQNATASARYWRDLTKQFGMNPQLVAAAYHAGPEAVRRAGNKVPTGEGYKYTGPHAAKVLALQPNFASNGMTSATTSTPAVAVSTAKANTATTGAAVKESPPPPTSGITALAEKWSGILEAWYDHGGQLVVGSFLVRGHPAWNIGHRLVTSDTRGEREFYIEGVAHRYDMRTGLYTTALRVTRGWYLDGKTDEQDTAAATSSTASQAASPVSDVVIPNPLKAPMKIVLR